MTSQGTQTHAHAHTTRACLQLHMQHAYLGRCGHLRIYGKNAAFENTCFNIDFALKNLNFINVEYITVHIFITYKNIS